MIARTLTVLSVALALGSCSSKSTSVDAHAGTDGATADAKVFKDAAKVFMDAPAGTTPLTVKNVDDWCTVMVNNEAVNGETVNVLPGTIALSAVANAPTFKLGTTPWHDTAGDTGAGEQGTLTGTGGTQSSATTVVVGSTAKCVWVCCPFSDTGSGCALPDQCP